MSAPKTSLAEALPRLARRLSVVLKCATVMGVVSSGAAALWLWPQIQDRTVWPAILVPPILAMWIFICVAILFPDLFPGDRIAYPVHYTLPIVFAVLLLVLVSFLTSTPRGLQRPPDLLLNMRIWLRPTLLIGAAILNGVALHALGRWSSRQPVEVND